MTFKLDKFSKALLLILSLSSLSANGHGGDQSNYDLQQEEWLEDMSVFGAGEEFETLACNRANSREIATVNEGNSKKSQFLRLCSRQTGGSAWCNQLVRPNPSSRSIFSCTYGSKQVHQLIHPDESTWKHAIQAVKLVQKLQRLGIGVCQIYNWWRPEPYNDNVGGAAGRHPYGTSVDVRFCKKSDQVKAFDKLCEYRKRGEIRAIGFYGGTGLHFGVGDHVANTWGRRCP